MNTSSNELIFKKSLPIYGHSWLINFTDIKPGFSAICGENRLGFFAIHYTALCIISVSIISSLAVLKSIYYKWKDSSSKVDFSVRFPLYLAVADILWGISHFTDHMYLAIVQTYPSSVFVKEALSMNLWFFFGYQQLMHASVSGYTYLHVVHQNKLKLGKWEWKLHHSWCLFLSSSLLVFHFCNSFGNTGYWMMADSTTRAGNVLSFMISSTCSFNAVTTTFCYYSIKRTVDKIKASLKAFNDSEQYSDSHTASYSQQPDSIASQCLTTYVWVAACLYCPLALLLWLYVIFVVGIQVLEPVSSFLIVVVANSSGWGNAYGYCYNEKLKKDKNKVKNLAQGRSMDVSSKSNVSLGK